MNIYEIIEAWDKDNLPYDLAKLEEILKLVELTGDQASHSSAICDRHESREYYYFTRVLMVQIAGDVRNKIDVCKSLKS